MIYEVQKHYYSVVKTIRNTVAIQVEVFCVLKTYNVVVG